MMLEDTLIYNPPNALTFAAPSRAAAPSTADLENDGLEFYLRMTRDIETVAGQTNRPAEGADLADSLLTALVATPAARTTAWRQFHRGVRALVAGFAPGISSPAFRRLRQFVRENADL
jgi:hypothetical protein